MLSPKIEGEVSPRLTHAIDQWLTDDEIIHANVALARDLLGLEVVICELVDGQVLDEADSFGDLDLLVLG
jgi:hypothetical protein